MLICYLLPKSKLYYTIYSLFTLVVLHSGKSALHLFLRLVCLKKMVQIVLVATSLVEDVNSVMQMIQSLWEDVRIDFCHWDYWLKPLTKGV